MQSSLPTNNEQRRRSARRLIDQQAPLHRIRGCGQPFAAPAREHEDNSGLPAGEKRNICPPHRRPGPLPSLTFYGSGACPSPRRLSNWLDARGHLRRGIGGEFGPDRVGGHRCFRPPRGRRSLRPRARIATLSGSESTNQRVATIADLGIFVRAIDLRLGRQLRQAPHVAEHLLHAVPSSSRGRPQPMANSASPTKIAASSRNDRRCAPPCASTSRHMGDMIADARFVAFPHQPVRGRDLRRLRRRRDHLGAGTRP